MKPDISATMDRGESARLVEPLAISETSRDRGALTDLAVALAPAFRRKPAGRHHERRKSREFTPFFLESCLDEVGFMEDLVQPDRLRILIWTEEEMCAKTLPPEAGMVVEAVLSAENCPAAT